MVRGVKRVAVAMAALLALSAPAGADIRSFNAAMQAQDYKKAAVEAASTWPGLDKGREDIGIIAREFGFAAYMAQDYAAARGYAQAAASAAETLGEDAQSRAASEILLRLSEHKLGPTAATRGRLFAALQARTASRDLDLISYFAADAVTAHDMQAGDWEGAAESAALAENLTAHGGADFRVFHFRFATLAAAARYLVKQDLAGLAGISSVEDRLVVAAADASADANALAPVYFEAMAWAATISSHFRSVDKAASAAWDKREDPLYKTDTYKAGLVRLKPPSTEGACRVVISNRSAIPDLPSGGRFRGMANAVVLMFDVGENGKTSNMRVMASAPVKAFGEALMQKAPAFTYERAKDAEPGCTFPQKNVQLTFIATVG